MEINEHIVDFDIWCKKCKWCDNTEEESPCDECLEEPVNQNSKRPVYYKEKD